MGERSKGKLSHSSCYGSSRADRFHSGRNSHETYWKNQRGNNLLSPNWQKDRRQAGGTDNPAANYYESDFYNRRLKKFAIPNYSLENYSSVQNTDPLFKCRENHRSTRNKVPLVNNMGVIRKVNAFKEDIENDADEDDDDEDELGGDYYDDEANAGKEGEENQDESGGSCETTEKSRYNINEDVDENYGTPPPLQQFSTKYEKDPLGMLERLKMLDLYQAKLKMAHERRLSKKYQDMPTAQRDCQEIPDQEISDGMTEEDDEISSRLFQSQKMVKNTMTCRQPRSLQQAYHYPRKNYTTKSALEPALESYGQKITCRHCGGTGSYSTKPTISRKNNCKLHEPAKVSFNTNEKFDVESGDQDERCSSGRRSLTRSNFVSISPTILSSEKPRRFRNDRSPNRR